ncbi:Scr1 family TA system antitoxin-like transcriptional regulator [Streptomyces millisiae]|uniref:Scr1 family TA system antitoxin-like transcriptional regulator n=1 Tax=Streptomyces millisiae TaxID=3075542 RepID=A0ABU2LWC9_9ACTN|nr:Scr1 family TA system antitoxin-like transcriptional regulator [Streptomyces sp. DSM 44918]MDT0321886.1 Scr1 family TA system antitoxin-like transcriptional regulator [Streptomyces sp. DSM 44918]
MTLPPPDHPTPAAEPAELHPNSGTVTAIDSGRTPAAAHLVLGTQVAALRRGAGLSVEEVAEATGLKDTTIHRIESAFQPPDWRHVHALMEHYGVDDIDVMGAIAFLDEASSHDAGAMDVSSGRHTRLRTCELEAQHIRSYQSRLIPHALRSEQYAASVARLPTAQGLDRAQPPLPEPRPGQTATFLLDEALLYHVTTCPGVLAEQMDHLLTMSLSGAAMVRVVLMRTVVGRPGPNATELYYGPQRRQRLICTEDASALVYYADRLGDSLHLQLERVEEAALSPEESRVHIGAAKERFNKQPRQPRRASPRPQPLRALTAVPDCGEREA